MQHRRRDGYRSRCAGQSHVTKSILDGDDYLNEMTETGMLRTNLSISVGSSIGGTIEQLDDQLEMSTTWD